MSLKLTRRQYAEMYGPTTGDQVRLGDTELFIEVEKDLIAENVATEMRSSLAEARSFEMEWGSLPLLWMTSALTWL